MTDQQTQTLDYSNTPEIVREQMRAPLLIRQPVLIMGEVHILNRGTMLEIGNLCYASENESDSDSDSDSDSALARAVEVGMDEAEAQEPPAAEEASMDEAEAQQQPAEGENASMDSAQIIDLCDEDEEYEDIAPRSKMARKQTDIFESPTLSLYVAQTEQKEEDDYGTMEEEEVESSVAQAQQEEKDDEDDDDEEVDSLPTKQARAPRALLPHTCFWVGGIGLCIETMQLDEFLGGDHFLARLATRARDGGGMRESIPLSTYVDIAAIARTHPNTIHVQLDEHGGPFFANAYFMPIIFDFIARRNNDPHAPMYVHALPNTSDDALALDTLQNFLFAGRCFRSSLILVDETEARYAEIALLPNLIKCHMTPDPTTGKPKRSNFDRDYPSDAMCMLEPMCLDPLWMAVVYNNRDRARAITHEAVMESEVRMWVDPNSPEMSAPTLNFYEARHMLAQCYLQREFASIELSWVTEARLERVERGVEFRVETFKLEDEPGARLDRVAGWNIGTGHRVVLRKDAEAKLQAKLVVARMASSGSAENTRRRAQVEADLNKLRTETKWFVL